jgi:hypothetical protein
MEGSEKIDLASLKPMKSGSGIDVTELKKFHNNQVKIEQYDIIQVPSGFTPVGPDGKKLLQWVVRFFSQTLMTVGEGDVKTEIKASELFNLNQDKEGKLTGYPTNKDSNLVKFMKDVGANTPAEVIGKTATVKFYEKDVGEGQVRGYLKFKY